MKKAILICGCVMLLAAAYSAAIVRSAFVHTATIIQQPTNSIPASDSTWVSADSTIYTADEN